MVVQVKDKVKDSTDMSKYPSDEWIVFQYVDGLVVTGGGTFDGQGASAWSLNQCLRRPIANSSLPVGSLGKRPKEGDVEGLHVKNYTISGTTNGPSRVKINNISFKNIRGTLTSKVAVNLLCSRAFPCKNVELDDIKLEYNDQGEASTASCTNVNEVSAGVQIPPTCL
ncbi:exopolygalacturonase-like [Amborella trichopoda]|uniref:exopolygalacturonase-like n=1 Tax=Amborella trichopoda TaxID=13333 RepID=UPI0009C113C4|nr:exopolygalacturonase-like [Amborella trichopoda]|eukprot:XP_020525719.1 exopolygalacturonase-like [Amborella trichopoda]